MHQRANLDSRSVPIVLSPYCHIALFINTGTCKVKLHANMYLTPAEQFLFTNINLCKNSEQSYT